VAVAQGRIHGDVRWQTSMIPGGNLHIFNLYTWGLALPSSFSIICLLILLQIKAFFFACFFQS
jgi:hypothetical protein